MSPHTSNRLHRWLFAPALLATLCAGCDAEPEELETSERRMPLGSFTRDITLTSMDSPSSNDATTEFNAVTRDPWFDLDRCEEPYLEYSKASGGTFQAPLSRTTQRSFSCNKVTEFWFEVPNTSDTYADFGLPPSGFNPNERLRVRIGAQNLVDCSNPALYYSASVYANSNPNGYGWPSRYVGGWKGDFLSVELEDCDMIEYADPGGPTQQGPL